MELQDSVEKLKGVGEKTCALFQKLHIVTIQDLITYYPRDYERYESAVPIHSLSEGSPVIAVRASLTGKFQIKRIRGLSITTGFIRDSSGKMQITFFNMPYIAKSVIPDKEYIFRGTLNKSPSGAFVLEQPKVFSIEAYDSMKQTMQPVYMVTKGITSHTLQKAVKQAFEAVEISEFLPETYRKSRELMAYSEALKTIHAPMSEEQLLPARRSLVYHEFFLFLLAIRIHKEENSKLPNPNPMLDCAQCQRLIESLPYKLTRAQLTVWQEIKEDLCGDTCMNRLIQGDVGSGKTILAFLALLLCVSNGLQGAMMTPTEVLAKQHFDSLTQLIKTHHLSELRPVLLTGSLSKKERALAYEKIQSGEANVILGTNALIQEKVLYQRLGLVITDEQHRFGVRQREALAGKGESVPVLVMSATPIPRTLAILLYGDMNLSVIHQLPANRLPIKNCVITPASREKAYRFMEKEVKNGRQVYIICPMVEEGELPHVENVTDYTRKIRERFPASIQVGMLHGKMKPAEKDTIMTAFQNHDLDILVSTTVIEVGVNVPNATVMMIENAERFGLAQLHQLRGRVGRGAHQSYCIFLNGNESQNERLSVLTHSNDGFHIAEEDLKLRGPGDIFGIRQSGLLDFKIGDIYTDSNILKEAGEDVTHLLQDSAWEKRTENAGLFRYYTGNERMNVDFRSI